jgi:hypothetical protein
MTRAYRYPSRAMALDCAQGATGFALAASLRIVARPAEPVIWVLAAAAAPFLVYFDRAVVRYLTQIELDERGIRALGPLGARIPWDETRSLRLNHNTTRSDRSGGWMQLEVRGTQRSIRIDSSLSDFAGLAALAGQDALRRGKLLDERIRSNRGARGISLHG